MTAAVRSFPSWDRSHKSTSGLRMAVRSKLLSFAPILINLQRDCATPLPVLRHVADAMASDMRSGLAVDGATDLNMILTYVHNLPTGYVMPRFLLSFFFYFLILFYQDDTNLEASLPLRYKWILFSADFQFLHFAN